jgi:DNA-binding NtrC family response regulator
MQSVMNELVALIDGKSRDWILIEKILEERNYQVHLVQSLEALEAFIDKTDCRVVLLDLDMVTVRNRFFRSLKKKRPDLNIIAASSLPYHPELKEAMTHHICACFRKPVEPDDLVFWLKVLTSNALYRGDRTGNRW